MKNAIEIKNLTKQYKKFCLDGLNLDVPAGCIIGLIGENGAGKTTLLKAILDIIKPDRGNIHLANAKEEIGVVLDGAFFPEVLTAKDVGRVMAGVYQTWSQNLFEQLLQEFGLPNDKAIKALSKGMRKKLEIATALAHEPKLLILDEPTSGLDPVVRNEIQDIFLKFIKDEEHTILFSTHITSDLEHIADKIVFINQGKIILDMDRDEILENYGILQCDLDDFDKIAKNDILRYKKSKYGYKILIENRNKAAKKYSKCIVDKITLEELMILMVKGEK